jgi:hypothetical protein
MLLRIGLSGFLIAIPFVFCGNELGTRAMSEELRIPAGIPKNIESDLTLLMKGDDIQKIDAARTLGEKKLLCSVPFLIKALEEKNQYVRAWAAWALGEIGDESAVGPLVRALEKYDALSKSDYFQQETKCLTEIYLALEELTGEKFGLDLAKWKNYWQVLKSGF